MKIKSRVFLVASLMILCCCRVYGQDSTKTVTKYYVELDGIVGTPSLNTDDGFMSRDLRISIIGYDLSPRFTLRLPLTLSTGLFQKDNSDITSYKTTGMAGLSVGYNFYLKESIKWQIAAEAGNTLSSGDDKWQFFYYDVGCKLYLGKIQDKANACFGVGIRQYFSENNLIANQNYLTPYVSIGIRLNYSKKK